MANDLGLKSEPMSDLFTQPQNQDEWAEYALTPEQILHFKEFGYLHNIPILSDVQVDHLRGELEALVDPGNPGNEFFYEYNSNESDDPDTVLFHALGAWRVTPGFHDILWAPRFRMAAYQLLGKGFRLFHDQLFSKPAHHGSVVSWHQDFSYWTWTTPMAHLTCWIGLDDVSTENGCMYYVPKSHRWGLLEKTGLAGDMDAVREVLDAEQIDCFDQRTPIEMKLGHASFHHPLMMHGSYENKSARSRRATIINVFADGVKSNRSDEDEADAPGTDNYPKVPAGEKMAGTYYPLLLDPPVDFPKADDIPTIDTI